MNNFIELINNAQNILNQIAGSDEFVRLLEAEAWDDPAITLSDANQALEDLRKAYESMKAQ